MNEYLTRSTIFAPIEPEPTTSPRRSLSRFVSDRLVSYGIPASVESLHSTSRTFLLISIDAEVATSTNVMADHGNAVSESLMREIRAGYSESSYVSGIFWRVEPPQNGSPHTTAVFQKARAELEFKIRERRAARVQQPA
ncbi:MAG: hypothetical protein ABSF50_16075 [Burkholderiaceae bacterium]